MLLGMLGLLGSLLIGEYGNCHLEERRLMIFQGCFA